MVDFAVGLGGELALVEALQQAGETRPVSVLRRDDTWSTHDQARRLCQAVAALGGGPESLRHAGASLWRAGATASVGEVLQALGSADAVFEVLSHLGERLEPVLAVETERVDAGHWLLRTRFLDGHDAYPEHCALLTGMVGQLPAAFGGPVGTVTKESCQLDGHEACTFRVTWDPAAVTEADAAIAELELRARTLEGRIHALEDTVGELVSGDSIDIVLQRVVDAAAQPVLAGAVVLALAPGPRVHAQGVAPAEARSIAEAVLVEDPDVPPTWTVVDVRSRRADYGRLVAIHERTTDRTHTRLILEAYGRVAAAALDSTAVIEEARRQADMATALLQLSQSLAEIGTSEEMARRVAAAVPAVIDCDQVVVALRDDHRFARVAAVHGYDEDTVGTVVPIDDTFLDHDQVRVVVRGEHLSVIELRVLGTAAALASVPLHAGGEVLGWIAVVVQDRPERLVDEAHLGDRLRGLAGQAATAMRNARLLDRMRFQAEHDPLTGLANQRLLHVHAAHAIGRARRDGNRVGLLFLDLDDFKDVNDTLGHAEGDRLLQLVTERLRSTLRDGDTVARFGGDEFVVLLPSITDDGATVADKIALTLAERFVVAGRDVRVSTSIGRAVFPDDGDDFGELLKHADIRMYRAKAERRRQRNRSIT